MFSEELVLIGLAVEVVDAGPKEAPDAVTPLQAGLDGEIAAVVDLLSNPGVDGEKGGAEETPALDGAVVDAELEFPRLAPAIDVEGPAGLGVQSQVGDRPKGHGGDEGVPGVVDPGERRVADHVLVAQMRAEMVVRELRLQRAPAEGERDPEAKVARDQLTV